MYEYHQASKELLDRIAATNESNLPKAVDWMAKTIIEDHIIHTFGTGHSHMIGLELFVRAGGLANVNAFLDSIVMTSEGAQRSAEMERISGVSEVLWNQYKIEQEDLFIIISNSGRNAMPIEMAQMAKDNGNKVIAITSMEQSKKYPVRIEGQKKLFEIADLVLDNCVPPGDGMLEIGGELTGAASTISGCFIVNLIATEAMKMAVYQDVKIPVYFSQNIDGFDNDHLYKKYENRIKHL
tara:strand:- start:7342 stop:8058 length:717 start_codon:yes stop_codon:yes gene_type:complete